ncbi:NADPH-dependent FMN reductase [Streptomyces sp. NPDC002055]|uniref:NADPH-dependent FMN reductase n=1 Tax=Streptomyces sp. NPDC002055 TaxID=3154534 RepID=UPI00331B62B4
MRLCLVSGTAAVTSGCHRLTALVRERAGQAGFDPRELDRSLLTLAVLAPERYASGELYEDPRVGLLLSEVTEADAVVLTTPVQHGSLSGALKNTLDHLPSGALAGKPVLLAATAVSLHNGATACDHLRSVVRSLGGWAAPTQIVAERPELGRAEAPGALLERVDAGLAELAELVRAFRAAAVAPV